MILSDFHQEIRDYVLSKCLLEGDEVVVNTKKGVFVGLPTIFYGHLRLPAGSIPGKYIDRTRANVKIEGNIESYSITDLILDSSIIDERLKQLESGWHFISLAPDFLEDLPKTRFLESDIVYILDENHENFNSDLAVNQYTIYSINYRENPISYELRSGKLIFNAKESQLGRCADGPVRLFYGNEKLRWASLKDEAEFYLLLGRYMRIYNPLNKSYYWNMEQAQALVELGKAHAVLQMSQGYSLINFWDLDIGQKMIDCPDLTLSL